MNGIEQIAEFETYLKAKSDYLFKRYLETDYGYDHYLLTAKLRDVVCRVKTCQKQLTNNK